MSFFSKLADATGGLDLQITFKTKGDKITVGVFPNSNNSEISERIKPIVMTGTAAELDEGFFEHLKPAMEKITGLVSNIEKVDEDLKKLEDNKKGKVAGSKAKEAEPKKDDKKSAAKPAANKSASDEKEPEETETTELKPKEVQPSIFE